MPELIEHIQLACTEERRPELSTNGEPGGNRKNFTDRHTRLSKSIYTFSESEPFVRDHRVFGQPALMGVTHPCLVVDGVSGHGAESFPITLRDIQFTGGPITLESG